MQHISATSWMLQSLVSDDGGSGDVGISFFVPRVLTNPLTASFPKTNGA